MTNSHINVITDRMRPVASLCRDNFFRKISLQNTAVLELQTSNWQNYELEASRPNKFEDEASVDNDLTKDKPQISQQSIISFVKNHCISLPELGSTQEYSSSLDLERSM
jgi:hypothetical protein